MAATASYDGTLYRSS